MDEIYIYLVELPDGIDEAVLPCVGGYTVYLDSRLCPAKMQQAYNHAMGHIENNDFEKHDVSQIETDAERRKA